MTCLCDQPLRGSILSKWEVQLMNTDMDAELAQNLQLAEQKPELAGALQVPFISKYLVYIFNFSAATPWFSQSLFVASSARIPFSSPSSGFCSPSIQLSCTRRYLCGSAKRDGYMLCHC